MRDATIKIYDENQLHWVLDFTFKEDACKISKENAAEYISVMRHFALNILKSYNNKKRLSISMRRRKCDCNKNFRGEIFESILSLFFL
jgi:hypothetical protein